MERPQGLPTSANGGNNHFLGRVHAEGKKVQFSHTPKAGKNDEPLSPQNRLCRLSAMRLIYVFILLSLGCQVRMLVGCYALLVRIRRAIIINLEHELDHSSKELVGVALEMLLAITFRDTHS